MKRTAVQRPTTEQTFRILVSGTGDPLLAMRWVNGAVDGMLEAGQIRAASAVFAPESGVAKRVVRRPS